MDQNKIELIKLTLLRNVGAVRAKALMERFGSVERVFRASFDELSSIASIGAKTAADIIANRSAVDVDEHLKKTEKEKINIVTILDKDYPENLKNIYDAPVVLYVKGAIKPGDLKSIAVVGTRRASIYGRNMANKFSFELANEGITVVSGMARGIDSSAHRGALNAGGRTIAVLGCGLDRAYPEENRSLMDEIAEKGAVVSEYPAGMGPLKQNFPMRNRIISGLSLGTLVVEAESKSGALITASLALEQGREVFSLPGRIDSATSKGTLGLIKQGAKLVESVNDILEEIGVGLMYRTEEEKEDTSISGFTDDERAVIALLADGPAHLDEVMGSTGACLSELAPVLLKLEMQKIIRERPGKIYERVYKHRKENHG